MAESKRLVSWEVRPEVFAALLAFAVFASVNRSRLIELLLKAFLHDRRLEPRRPALTEAPR